MIKRVQQWLASPVFPEDEAKTRRAAVVNMILLTNVLLAGLMIFGNMLGGRTPESANHIDVAFGLISLLLRGWLKRDHVQSASILLVTIGLISVTVAVATLGTIRAPASALFLLVVMVSGLLFDWRGAVAFTFLTSAVIAGVVTAEQAGLLPRPDFTVTATQWVTYATVLAATTAITYLTQYTNRAALRRAARELAERHAVEVALRDSEARFRSYFELPLTGRAITAPDKGWLDVNATLCQLLGYTKAELLQMTWAQLTHPDDLAADVAQFDRVIAGKIDGHTLEKRFIRKDGQLVYAEVAVQCLRRPDGALDYFVVLVQDITARKRDEAALRENRTNLSALIENTDGSIWAVDRQCRLIVGNALFHRNVAAVLGRELAAGESVLLPQFPPAATAEWQGYYDRALQGERFSIEALTRFKAAPEYTEYRFNPIIADSGHITGVTVFGLNITERKQAEEALRESEARLLRAESVAHFGNWAFDLKRQSVLTSAGARSIYGLQGDTWTVAEVQQIPLPEYRAALDAALRGLIERGEPYNVEFRIRRPSDGQLLDIHSIAEYDPARQVVFGVVQDITARKQIELALQISLTKYQTLFDSLPLGVTVADRDGQITESNQEAIRLLGLSQAAQRQRQIDGAEWRIIRPDGSPMPPEEFASVRALKEQQRVANVEMGLVKNTAETTWINVTAAPVPLPDAQGVIIAYMDVSDRRQMEEALRHSEARWQSVIKTSPDGICLAGLDGAIQYVSDKLLAMHGYTDAEEMIGRDILEFVHESSHAEALRHMSELLVGHYLGVAEYQVVRRDGTTFYAEVNAEVVRTANSQAANILLVERDVTVRHRAEETLAASNDFHLSLLRQAPALIWRANTTALCDWFNETWLSFTGRTLEQERGNGWAEGVHPDDYERSLAIYLNAFAARQPFMMEYRLRRADGVYRWIADYGSPFNTLTGEFGGYIGYCYDIHDRRQAEADLHRRNDYLAALQETTLELSAHLSLDYLLENTVNRAASLVEADGGFFDMVEPTLEHLVPQVGTGVLTEALFHTTLRGEGVAGIVWQTGEPLVIDRYDEWANRVTGFSRGQLGSIIGVPLIHNDQVLGVLGLAYAFNSTRTFGPEAVEILTQFARLAAIAVVNARLYAAQVQATATLEQHVAERTAELQMANRRLTELDRLKDEFLSRISHELRTPLTSIKIYLELLETSKPEKQAKYLATLKREAERLHGLIEEVLLFSQLNLQSEPLEAGWLNVNDVVASRQAAWEQWCASRQLDLNLDLPPNLPLTRSDGELLTQMLNRLLRNAVDYTSSGTVTVSTDLSRPDGQWLMVRVTDTGPGITPEDLPHIFERFYRGRAAADYKTPGTGIGLAICHEIAQKLGGRITVTTQVGAGSTFTVWLPSSVS